MKFVTLLLIAAIVSPAFAQTPTLVARISSLSTSQCRRGSSTYEIRIGGNFELENQSKSTVLVSKKIDMISTVTAALSADATDQKKYVFEMQQEFGGDADNAPPRLKDFIALKPGEKGTVEMDAVVSAEKTAGHGRPAHLGPGKYWFQFHFFTLPNSFPGNFDAWKEKWKRSGVLTAGPFITQPFPVDIAPDDNAKACDSE